MLREEEKEVGKVKASASKESLQKELGTLRASLKQARGSMIRRDEDVAKMGALVARLSDSIARVMLAQQKLDTNAGRSARLQAELDRVLEELGLGEL